MFFESLDDPLHIVDKDLRIIYGNTALIHKLESMGLETSVIGKTIFVVFYEEDEDV